MGAMANRPLNSRVRESVFASFTPADSPRIYEDYVEDPDLADLRTTELKPGDTAPDFELPLLGGGTFHLAAACAERPQALVFGSYTCPPFRQQVPEVDRLREQLRGQVDFTLVYVYEAHAEDGWVVTGNREAGVREWSPRTLDERAALAARLVRERGLAMPVALDGLDDRVCRQYGGMPNRLTLVGSDGTLVYLSDEGPVGFRPDELSQAIGSLPVR